jgi:hypothetical protein
MKIWSLFQIGGFVEFLGKLPFESLVVGTQELKNIDQHYSLRSDLVEHLWTLKGATTY